MMMLLTTAVLNQHAKAPTAEVRSSSGRFLGLKHSLLGRNRCGSQTPQPVGDLGFSTAEINETIQNQQFRTNKRYSSTQRSPTTRSFPHTSSLTASGSGGKAAVANEEGLSSETLSDAKPNRNEADCAPVIWATHLSRIFGKRRATTGYRLRSAFLGVRWSSRRASTRSPLGPLCGHSGRLRDSPAAALLLSKDARAL